MKLAFLIFASALMFIVGVGASGIICNQCTGEEETCAGADDNGNVVDCLRVQSCYADLEMTGSDPG